MGTNGEPSNNEEESNIPTIAITNETCELKDMERIPQSIANNCGNDVEDSTNKEINNMEEIKLEDGCKDVDCNTKEEIEKQPLLQISTSISSSLNPNNLLGKSKNPLNYLHLKSIVILMGKCVCKTHKFLFFIFLFYLIKNIICISRNDCWIYSFYMT